MSSISRDCSSSLSRVESFIERMLLTSEELKDFKLDIFGRGGGGGGGGRSDKVFSWNTSKYRNYNKEKIETKCQFMFVVVMVVVGTSGSVYSEGKLMTD